MTYQHVIGTIREFNTENFRVIVDAIEDDHPDMSWDEDGSAAAGIESGEYVLFCARARVFHVPSGTELASDYLGGCIHPTLEDFEDHRRAGAYNRELAAKGESARCGSYFADMVREVCGRAREELAKLQSVRVRA